jgi:hypothetical protein
MVKGRNRSGSDVTKRPAAMGEGRSPARNLGASKQEHLWIAKGNKTQNGRQGKR